MESNKVVPYSWAIFAVVLAVQSIGLGFSVTCMPPFFTTIADELRLNSTQIGVAWGMIGFGSMLFSIKGKTFRRAFGAGAFVRDEGIRYFCFNTLGSR